MYGQFLFCDFGRTCIQTYLTTRYLRKIRILRTRWSRNFSWSTRMRRSRVRRCRTCWQRTAIICFPRSASKLIETRSYSKGWKLVRQRRRSRLGTWSRSSPASTSPSEPSSQWTSASASCGRTSTRWSKSTTPCRSTWETRSTWTTIGWQSLRYACRSLSITALSTSIRWRRKTIACCKITKLRWVERSMILQRRFPIIRTRFRISRETFKRWISIRATRKRWWRS